MLFTKSTSKIEIRTHPNNNNNKEIKKKTLSAFENVQNTYI